MDDDLYADYDYDINVGAPGARGVVPGTATTLGGPVGGGFRPTTGLNMGGGSGLASRGGAGLQSSLGGGARMGTAAQGGGGGEVRPMTSVSGAGFSTKQGQRAFDPLQGRGPAPPLAEKADNSPEDKSKDFERQVHKLIEASAKAAVDKDFDLALEKAKDAGKRERALCKHREAHGLVDSINIDLTYAVCFNLAHAYHSASMHDEALHTYSLLVKNKQYPQSGRLRVNMGNIYYEQQKYQSAIKMYRMALDQIPNTGKHIRFKIFRNIGNAFVRLGQFSDAVQSYETIMGGDPDFHTGFNLILCYYALGDAEKMRRGFQKLIAIPIAGAGDDDDLEQELLLITTNKKPSPGKGKEVSYNNNNNAKEVEEEEKGDDAAVDARLHANSTAARADGLRHELKRREKEALNYMLTAARLVAPELKAPEDPMFGYKLVIDALKADHEQLASEMEIERALRYMRHKDFGTAIEALKAFEKKDLHLKAMAATNLSFIYFLEGDVRAAERYADMAYEQDRYNARALVNKGNCLTLRGDHDTAKQFYLEAIGVEADCVEAIYNLGLVNLRIEAWAEALQAFEKLHQVVPNNAEVIFQIGALHEARGQLDVAMKWYNILVTRVPSDPGVLLRMGQICNRTEDEAQAFHFHLESYRHYPVSLDVISWLGVWYVKSEMYEKAIHFFDRAAQIQPNEVKWRLMVTSCYRRMGNYQRALELYQQIHHEHPDNAECLRYLVAICKDLGQPHDHYQNFLSKLDRNNPPAATHQPGAVTRNAPPPRHQMDDAAANATSGLRADNNNTRRAANADHNQPTPTSSSSTTKKTRGGMQAPKATGLAGAPDPERPRTGMRRPDDDNFDDADLDDLLPT